MCKGRDIVWYIDNVSTLSALVKGGSKAPDVDRAAAVVSLVAQMCNARVWFEYIESKSNWSDGLSRLLVEDPWVASRGFTLRQMEVPAKPWIVPIQELPPLLESEVGAALE